jgi:hypothetical protein
MLLSQTLRPISSQIVIVDVGAMPTTDVPRYTPLVQAGLADLWAIDCDPRFSETTNAANVHAVNACIADGAEREFFTTDFRGCSSLYEPDPEIIDLFHSIRATGPIANFRVSDRSTRPTVRFDDAIACEPDLITIDAQGGELDVLGHATRALASAVLVDLEVEFVPLYKGQPTFGDVSVFMAARGWMLHKLYDVSGRCFEPCRLSESPAHAMSQMLWGRAVFARDFRALRSLTETQLIHGAAIAFDVYLSYDLAHLYLAEYDRRRSTNLRQSLVSLLPKGNFERLYLNESRVVDLCY